MSCISNGGNSISKKYDYSKLAEKNTGVEKKKYENRRWESISVKIGFFRFSLIVILYTEFFMGKYYPTISVACDVCNVVFQVKKGFLMVDGFLICYKHLDKKT